MKNYNMILTEKKQKNWHYHLEKLMNMNILQKKKYCQAKLTYSPLGKAFRKQKKIEEQGKKKHMLLQNKTKDWSL